MGIDVSVAARYLFVGQCCDAPSIVEEPWAGRQGSLYSSFPLSFFLGVGAGTGRFSEKSFSGQTKSW